MFVSSKSVGLLVCVVVVLHGNFVRSKPEYCDIESCDPGQHTLCLYPNSEPGPRCENLVEYPMSYWEKYLIVDAHNSIRKEIAVGGEVLGITGRQPPVGNMREFVWNDDLEEIAQRWADQCTDGQDTCRNLPNLSVGQNVGTMPRAEGSTSIVSDLINVVISIWRNEVFLADETPILWYKANNVTNNYTQLVWADTGHIGCGYNVFKKDEQEYVRLVCNYGPAGNKEGANVYSYGEPASACPNGRGSIAELCK